MKKLAWKLYRGIIMIVLLAVLIGVGTVIWYILRLPIPFLTESLRLESGFNFMLEVMAVIGALFLTVYLLNQWINCYNKRVVRSMQE